MREQQKLNKYSQWLVGLAYEEINPQYPRNFAVRIYLVLDKDGKLSFVKHSRCDRIQHSDIEDYIQAVDAKPLSYWANINAQRVQERQASQELK